MDYITLNDGNKMPQLGFGVFQVPDLSQAQQAVSDAIDVGYRLFDTAAAYGNEEAVGQAIKNSNINRDEFFITSKLWVDHFTYEKAQEGIDDSLKKLGLDYMDLYLLHQPYGVHTGHGAHLKRHKKLAKLSQLGFQIFIQIN